MKEIAGRQVLDTLQEIADPKHTALLVIDIQNDNASPKGVLAQNARDISWVRQILPNVQAVLAEARRLGVPVMFMRRTRSKDWSLEPDNILRKNEKPVHSRGIKDYEMEGTWGNEVLDELEPRPNERQIIKYRSSSFIGTPLDMLLKNLGIKAAVVVGIVTHACVESTVRDLHQYGYYPVVLKDGVAGSRKELHDASILTMSSTYDVVTTQELLKEWRSAKPVKS